MTERRKSNRQSDALQPPAGAIPGDARKRPTLQAFTAEKYFKVM
jgi:hypothetical protein